MLDSLLKQYEDSESLYKKTKKESAGFLLVYSRKDLERMQAFKLEDVLKTIRMFTLQTNRMGATNLLNAGAGQQSMSPIKLYIDDFEVSTTLQKNAFDMYGNMDIYFVDHIEIYQGGSSIVFGNEPGSMVVRLYSKNPQRENSTSMELGVNSKYGRSLRILDTGIFNDYNYLAYASKSKLNYNTYDMNKQELSRDAQRYQVHFRFSKDDDFTIELDGILNKADIFSGFGVAPLGEETNRAYGYITFKKYLTTSIELSFSATQEKKEAINDDAILIPNSITNSVHMNVYSNTYKTSLKKKIINANNDLSFGVEFQKKVFNVKSFTGINRAAIQGPNETNIYMIYLEELYNINQNHILALSIKLDRYEDNYSEKSNEYSIRLGYAGIINENFSTKLFTTKRYIYPNMFQTSFTPPNYKANPSLNAANVDVASGEIEYNKNKTRVVFGFAYKEIDNALSFSPIKKMYINSKDTIYFHRYYLRNEYKFDYDNKIIIEGFKAFKEIYASPGSGVLIQIFNTFGKFDIYNELVYREGYILKSSLYNVDIPKGYDYTLALTYSINKKLKIKLKGDNLLNKASKTPIGQGSSTIKVPIIERKTTLTMEYTF